MTTSYSKRRNKKVLALLLSAFMVTTFAASFTACSSDSSDLDDSQVTTTESDSARISNGTFEYFDDNDGLNRIVTSVTGWSKSNGSSSSGTASSSKAASGIIDTDAEKWEQLTTNSSYAHDTLAEAEANWDNLTVKDKLEFYDWYEEEDDDNDVTELDFYDAETDAYNISIDDVPDCANPGTHYASDSDEAGKNTNVLMLHNTYSDKRGTAQKYTSSTNVTVEPGTSAKFSVWVKTLDLTYGDTKGDSQPVSGERGAYIGVTHTVGGTTLDQLQIKNIDTAALNASNADNGWVQYSFYLKGCSYASSTFTVVLGLGQGGGTDKWEYVDGYAFFDDVQCTVVSNDTFDTETNGKNYPTVDADTYAERKLFRADTADYKNQFTYVIDLYKDFNAYTLEESNLQFSLTKDGTYVSAEHATMQPAGTTVWPGLTLSTADDLVALTTAAALRTNSSSFVQKVVANHFTDYPFEENEPILMLLSAQGAAYTAELTDGNFVLGPDEYMALSFRLKTSDFGGATGAGIIVNDKTNKTTLSSLDTTSSTTVDIDKINDDGTIEIGGTEDVYDGWQQCFVFVKNETETDKEFSVSFTYGPTTVQNTSNGGYYAGYAAFTDFQIYTGMSEKEFSYAATGTYATSVSLVGDENSSADDAAFDVTTSTSANAIETGIATPRNYSGVYAGSKYLFSQPTLDKDKDVVNDYAYAGLINQKYADAYASEAAADPDYWLSKIGFDTTGDWWSAYFGSARQPLLVYNNEQMAYGYYGSSQTISSSSYATVSVRVKASVGATASVYLIDTSDSRYDDALTLEAPKYTYWYDSDGNICAADPADFTTKAEKTANIAFYLEDNGLYAANPKWSGYTADMAGKYYANMSNYEKDDEGNYILADGSHSYNYDSSVWKHDGNDGIAYYYQDGKYYAYSNHTTEVTDLSAVSGLARYDYSSASPKEMKMEVTGTGEWVTCTFYIHTGSTAKNYRLEVWSGSRDGEKQNAAGSYVIFDSETRASIDSNYTSMIDEILEKLGDDYEETYKYTFSFFDTPSYLRYDSTIDEDEVGNAYSSYDATTYTEGVAYLYYTDDTTTSETMYTMFADYSYAEVSVTADTTTDDTTTDDEDDEDDDTNWWLFISSLVIAIVLILVVVSLGIQKLVKYLRRKKAKAAAAGNATAYKAAKRRYARPTKSDKAKSAPKPDDEKTSKPDGSDPYDD